MNSKISIIIPAFNEAKTIKMLLEKVLFESKNWDSQIIVVNDGSKDSTLDIVESFMNEIIIVDLKENRGKGGAIKEGLKYATGEIVIIQDADLELDPSEYKKLLKPLIEKKAEVVYGSRILGKSKYKKRLFFWGGKFITFLANLLHRVNITDQTNGYKVLRRETLESMKLESDGFEICSEITAKIAKMGLKISEVPVSYYPRKKSEGKKLKIRDGIMASWTLIKYKFHD